VNNGLFSREMANNGRFLFNKYFTDSGGLMSLDRLGVRVNVEHRML